MENTDTRDLHMVRKAMWDASMSNHSRYMDPATGLFREDFVENRPCPVCGIASPVPVFRKSGGTYCRCEGCGMLYLDPVLRDEALRDYYTNNHSVQSEVVRNDGPFYTSLYQQGLDLLGPRDAAGRSLLDIGCSAGGFLDLARARGYATTGLELNAAEAAVCRAAGHEVLECVLEELPAERMFDAITLWDVFEHVKDGSKLLRKARNHLRPGGSVFLQSPTQDSLAARILQEKCNMFDGLEHVNIYSHANIRALAEACGFSVAALGTVIAEEGVLANHLAYRDPYLGISSGSGLVPVELDRGWILERGLGYKFQVVLSAETR